ncbi:hypothetical protein MGN70_014534 [Eutypa lata]|nr:hypothetical protein MGN70_014534 [Eutypa lata]
MKSQIATTLTAFALAGTSAAFPTIPSTFQPLRARNGTNAARLAEQVAQVAPETTTCDLGETPECRTNVDLAPFLLSSLESYGVTEAGTVAAVVALTAFESANYKYKHNVYPGTIGQGTANMQMYEFNYQYARSITALADDLAALGFQADDDTGAGATDDQKTKVLALVTPDEYNFGSGAWYLTARCPETAKALAAGTDAAWQDYMTNCVGTTDTPEREAYWTRAKAAFGLQ